MPDTSELTATTDIVSSTLMALYNADYNRSEQEQFKDFAYPREYETASLTEQKLYDMFVGPVDRNICDSGSAYGCRNEYNRKRNLFTYPRVYFAVEQGKNGEAWFAIYVNTFLLLCSCLEYDPAEDKRFQEWYRKSDGGIYEIEDRELAFHPAGEAGLSWHVYNSYNDTDSRLDNVILFAKYPYEKEWYDDGTSWFILKVHGGCDVRSGYSDPVLFKLVNAEKFNWGYTEASMYCTKCEFVADYSFDGSEIWSVPDGQENYLNKHPETAFPCKVGETPEKGSIVCTKDGRLFCPFCGGELAAGSRDE